MSKIISVNAQRWKRDLFSYAGMDGPDQTAHAHILIKAFFAYDQNHWILYAISRRL